MPELTSNVEFAQQIHEHGHHSSPSATNHRAAQWVEIMEAIVLAAVAVATAWSGYQAAKWDALSAQHYNVSSRTAIASQERAMLAGQDRLYDITTFNGWVAAKVAGNDKLSAYYERRFRPEYSAALTAWQKLDPFTNPLAPPGPIFMAEYTNANRQESWKLGEEAQKNFERGVSMRETGDRYVKGHCFAGYGVTSDRPESALRNLWSTGRRGGDGVRSSCHGHPLDLNAPASIGFLSDQFF